MTELEKLKAGLEYCYDDPEVEALKERAIEQAAMVAKIPGYDPTFGATAIIVISGDRQESPFMDSINRAIEFCTVGLFFLFYMPLSGCRTNWTTS